MLSGTLVVPGAKGLEGLRDCDIRVCVLPIYIFVIRVFDIVLAVQNVGARIQVHGFLLLLRLVCVLLRLGLLRQVGLQEIIDIQRQHKFQLV